VHISVLWKGIQYTFAIGLILALTFTSSVFGVLLLAKMTGQEWITAKYYHVEEVFAEAFEEPLTGSGESAEQTQGLQEETSKTAAKPPKKASAMLDAPAIHQFPELPAGCEVTSLTMLLQFRGIQKSKTVLAEEMKKDPTPIRWGPNGTIAYWGDPNQGFVGDVTGGSKAFGIYHAALYELLKEYVPSGMDMTGESFDTLEHQISMGIPVIAWTTIYNNVPDKWVTWDSPGGEIRTTFMEHAVLLVGYDENYVYANDPWTGKKNVKISKDRFIASWEAMGKQALSYTETGDDKGGI
jgi:uncharacterized protein YvpB